MRRLFNEYEMLTPEGQAIDRQVAVFARQLLAEKLEDGLSLRDVERVAVNAIQGVAAEVLLRESVKRRKAVRQSAAKRGWTPFYFDGNLAFGIVDSPAQWERLKQAYRDSPGGYPSPADLLEAKNCPRERGLPKFGFVVECDGPQTLRDFFVEHGMDTGHL